MRKANFDITAVLVSRCRVVPWVGRNEDFVILLIQIQNLAQKRNGQQKSPENYRPGSFCTNTHFI